MIRSEEPHGLRARAVRDVVRGQREPGVEPHVRVWVGARQPVPLLLLQQPESVPDELLRL